MMKSHMIQEAADKLGLPVIDIKLAVERQRDGDPIVPREEEIKVEYQLRTSRGTIIAAYSCPIRAMEDAQEKFRVHGKNMPNQHLFKITTITEQM